MNYVMFRDSWVATFGNTDNKKQKQSNRELNQNSIQF
jgi:hypothetical protein